MSTDQVLSYLAEHQDRHLEQLCDWLRIPSISSESAHQDDVIRASEFTVAQLEQLGLSVEVIDRGGHPLVYAQSEQRPDRKTLLFYGHYDVQPVDPLELWTTPPFEPRIEDGKIHARGASDDKGQVFCHLKALEAYTEQGLDLPVNVKFIIEGEEECGGHSIYEYTEENPEKLACDAVVISDTTVYNAETPAICYSLKGLCYMEIRLQGPAMDLHSGTFGGVTQNPGNAIATIIAGLKDDQGRCLVPGFYDDVIELDRDERDAFARLDYTDAVLHEETGAPAPFGEAGYTTLERMWGRPTCDVNGIATGYGGEGAKTVIPARALAKVSMRLVPDQDPEKIARAFQEHVQAICPEGVVCEVENLHNANPVLIPRDAEVMQAGLRALKAGFGNDPVFVREGGSIPIVGTFQECLQTPVMLLGYGLSTDNIHSPNEKFDVRTFESGCRTTAVLLEEVARG